MLPSWRFFMPGRNTLIVKKVAVRLASSCARTLQVCTRPRRYFQLLNGNAVVRDVLRARIYALRNRFDGKQQRNRKRPEKNGGYSINLIYFMALKGWEMAAFGAIEDSSGWPAGQGPSSKDVWLTPA